jgi:hypothetical protein
MRKTIFNTNEQNIKNGGALKFESYPNSDAGSNRFKINGVKGLLCFRALWKYFIDIYKRTGGKNKDIIAKLYDETEDLLIYLNNPANKKMLILDYNFLGYSITLQIINNKEGNGRALTYYIIINLPQDLHLTVHFNRSYKVIETSKAAAPIAVSARAARAERRANATTSEPATTDKSGAKKVRNPKKVVVIPLESLSDSESQSASSVDFGTKIITEVVKEVIKGDKGVSQKTEIYEFIDSLSILTPIHLTSNTKHRSYYMSIDKITHLIEYFINVMPEGYDINTYLNKIMPCIFIGTFCTEMVELIGSSFIINRIVIKIETYLNGIARSGQIITDIYKDTIINIITKIIKDEQEQANKTNPVLHASFLKTSIDELISHYINDPDYNNKYIITSIKSLLYSIEGYKDINTFLYDTNLVRGTSGYVRSGELKDLSRYFKTDDEFKKYCDKYYSHNKADCNMYSKSAKDVMGDVVDKINQDAVILFIGNLAVTALVDTMEDLIKIKGVDFSVCVREILKISNNLFLTMRDIKDKYTETSNFTKTVDNLDKMLKKLNKYNNKYSMDVSIPESHESPQAASQQSPMGYQQSPMGYQQSPMGYQQSPDGYEQSPMGYQQSPDGYEQSPMGYPIEQLNSLLYSNRQTIEILKNILRGLFIQREAIKNELNNGTPLNEMQQEIINVEHNIFSVTEDIRNIENQIVFIMQQLSLQGQQGLRIGGSKVVSKVITRYLDKIKEVRAIIKELNDNKKKNKSKILTKRMLIKNLYSKIKIQREKEKEKRRINAAKKAK